MNNQELVLSYGVLVGVQARAFAGTPTPEMTGYLESLSTTIDMFAKEIIARMDDK